MRYEVRFSNGFWKTFDTFMYCSTAIHLSEAEAIMEVEIANNQQGKFITQNNA